MPTSLASEIRRIALSLDGVREIDHWGRPAFRTSKRIFAVIRPDGLYLHLPDERKEFLFEADPAVFVKYRWGKTDNVIAQPDRISGPELTALIREAWEFSQPPARKAGRSHPRATARRNPRS